MTRGIPKVREWTLRCDNGRVFSVLAPTRRLAILNLRAEPALAADRRVWGALRSVGCPRNSRIGGPTVVEVFGAPNPKAAALDAKAAEARSEGDLYSMRAYEAAAARARNSG